MSEAQDWNSAGEHRKENNGHMANGGGQDLRRERSSGAPRRAQKQDRPVPRPQRRVRASCSYVLSYICNLLTALPVSKQHELVRDDGLYSRDEWHAGSVRNQDAPCMAVRDLVLPYNWSRIF